MLVSHNRLNAVGHINKRGLLLINRYRDEVNYHLDSGERFKMCDFDEVADLETNALGQWMVDRLVEHASQLFELEQLDHWFHEGKIPPSEPWQYYDPPSAPILGRSTNKLLTL